MRDLAIKKKKFLSSRARVVVNFFFFLFTDERERERNGGRVDATAETADRGERFVGFDRE